MPAELPATRRAGRGIGTGVQTRIEPLTRHVLAPAGVYLAVRLVGLVVLAILAATHDRALVDVLKSWDGDWYLNIAENGYARGEKDLVDAAGNFSQNTTLAFFPGYPLLIALVGALTATSLPYAGLLVSLVAGVVAAYGITRLADDRRTGLVLVGLFASTPMAVTLSMVYSEALFSALAAWALVGVRERRWWPAALCCVGAGLVRPSAAVLILIVVVAVLLYGRTPRAVFAAVVCPLGLAGFLLFAAERTGDLFGWFALQEAGWGTAFDGGVGTGEFVGHVLTSDTSLMETANALVVLGALVLCVVVVVRRMPWPLAVYGIGLFVMTAGSSGVTYSKMRLLVPAFTLLLPVAAGLAQRRTGTVLAVLSATALTSGWFGGYALTAWPYAI
jgi:hypothetical protein